MPGRGFCSYLGKLNSNQPALWYSLYYMVTANDGYLAIDACIVLINNEYMCVPLSWHISHRVVQVAPRDHNELMVAQKLHISYLKSYGVWSYTYTGTYFNVLTNVKSP